MGLVVLSRPQPGLAVFGPPYQSYTEIDLSWTPPVRPPRGLALLWWLADAVRQEPQFIWLHDRPRGLPLIIILPPARHIHATLPLLNHIAALAPRAVLPSGQVAAPSRVQHVLRSAPRSFADAITAYLIRRELLRGTRVREEVHRVLALAREVTSVSQLARRMCMSRRTLGRHFAAEGLPVPSHWLQFGRLIRVVTWLQSDRSSVGRIALRARYPDGFTLSNQMKRLIGFRPTEIRQLLGWEWVVEAWLDREIANGAIDQRRYGRSIRADRRDGKSRSSSPDDAGARSDEGRTGETGADDRHLP